MNFITHHLVTAFIVPVTLLAQSPGVQLANGFDYPIGDWGYSSIVSGSIKRPLPEGFAASAERNGVYPSTQQSTAYRRWGSSTGWHNAQDTGSFLSDPGYNGFHPGEDWNLKPNDVGEIIYCVANGEVKGIKLVGSVGWLVHVRHWLPDATPNLQSDNQTIDSLYLHVAPLNINGSPNRSGSIGEQSDLGLYIGMPITKNQPLARIGKTSIAPHLHLEMRNKPADISIQDGVWPNDNNSGYYTSYSKMQLDGIIDPSDFIDMNRVLYGLTDVPTLKSSHINRVEMSNCVSLGIMNNTNEQAWLNIERPLTRAETTLLLQKAANAYKTDYFHGISNQNSIPRFTSDAEVMELGDINSPRANLVLYDAIQLFAQKGFVDVSQSKFRVNDPVSFGEAVHFLWRVFELGIGGPSGAEELFKYRRQKLANALFLKPASLNWDLLAATTPLLYQRVNGTLTRQLTPRRLWIYQRGIADVNFNYADPIRRHVMAKLIINTLLWRMSNSTQTSL